MPGFTAPKLLWVRKHEPEIFARIAKVLLPKDYLRYRLTGSYMSDASDSAGTLWLDVRRREWSDTMLKACGLTREHMPEVREGSQEAGRLSHQLAQRWGMSQVSVQIGKDRCLMISAGACGGWWRRQCGRCRWRWRGARW